MTTFSWPAIFYPPRDFGYFLIEPDTSGGAALGGGEQFVFSPGPRWGASMTLDVRNKDEVLALRALRTNLKGRANPIALPNFDGKRLSWPLETFDGKPTGVVLHPGVTRNRRLDGTDYEDDAIPDDSEIEAVVATDAALRATTIVIEITQGGDPLPGQQFGIGSRLYEIGSVEAAGDNWSLTIQPPLRAAAAEDAVVKFTRPTCLMRCMNLNEELKKLEQLRFATLNLEFQEYL